ncbi:MAG: hypothetical protein JXP73_13920 [Deltaproteobacteria bacterium]|nr:hypothetical protein [Deltaproteobacteria bacterium]
MTRYPRKAKWLASARHFAQKSPLCRPRGGGMDHSARTWPFAVRAPLLAEGNVAAAYGW